jgi:UDP-N-acetylmuramyl pentapeptide synthase
MGRRALHTVACADDAVAVVRKVARRGDTVLLKASRGVGLERVFERF